MMRKTWVVPFLALGGAVASCGGAVDTGLFGDPNGAIVGQDASDAVDGPTSSDAAGRSDGRISDGGTRADREMTDAGMPPNDAALGTDTNPPGPEMTINCATSATTCAVGTQVCCRASEAPPPSFACTAVSGCNAVGNMPIPCDDANDCTLLGHPGEICCAQVAGSGRASSVACMPVDSCAGGNQVTVCDPLAPDPCPNGGTCRVSITTLPGFTICF